MEIVYYKSIICPRCIPTSRFIKKIKSEYPHIKIREIEILKHMKEAKQNGVHSIPTIKIGDKIFNGVPPWEEFESLIS